MAYLFMNYQSKLQRQNYQIKVLKLDFGDWQIGNW